MPTLNWLTRDDDRPSASKVPCRLLEEVPDRSAGQRDTGNRLIQGDTLEALKSLLPFQAGQVKGGFGDSPCNTRKAFRYDDDRTYPMAGDDVSAFGCAPGSAGRRRLQLGYHG